MQSTDLDLLERRARRGYERSRLFRSLLGVLPVALLAAVVLCLGIHPHPHVMLALGAGVFVLGAALLWYGRDPARAVLPGLAAGFLPLCLALCAQHLGHRCSEAECIAMCLPACAAGGVLAAGIVSWYGALRKRSAWFWTSASSLALLTGAVGATCAGLSGVLAVAAGYSLGFASGFVFKRLRRVSGATHERR
ncbi:MAG TPA: hypothetical protein VGC79_21120 [Polyangiaceae bacterium]